ncbi:hypothetical protein COCC4DRAFT_142716 [Bipolaris maydis ATCC 48331]|uniref:Heterokaryon incompatibility domain-containing protein n=2 Tax=Cochliobolus heterostrophus TaxID=5016 RepID=M2UIV4_COCH5|nr:uncharacterized protein COCC4DRAFT_142716 [Bipolaris maydis ATCC 48331]EMD87842.1 hypothetical protein COCHEDRAFT_1216963 [Bipolaris maydis C5]KAJ5024135.1 heterokaryon incompatibility protein-domain-containing protein [Bipolaris maydis]ENI03356.1 hypothetical protein COCC4DRAFT_142716 [Bipolaris maydis ATCC 48331]KAJ5057528.1 heterokaryon incompatibility protein-domain-containing protein [Bipolaris maydis]KAJ6206836.1 heterokaryon incompatibility protein-domain-containing protein [Bipolari
MVSTAPKELCTTCKGILDIIRVAGWYKNLAYHQSLSSLRSSAETACCICALVFSRVYNRDSDSSDPPETLFPIDCESDTSSASWQHSFELILQSQTATSFRLRFYFETIEDLQGGYVHYEPSVSTDSPQTWDLIEHWVRNCTQNHTRCNASLPEQWAPTRLLDVGTFEKDVVRLVNGKDASRPKQNYATLSHCWGITVQLPRTTMHNIEEFQQLIPYQQFPKTFRDAVKIARKFHLRYLWIDSLCIIQDDGDDWMREAASMSNIYRYSFINIAATGASDSSQGCFWERNPQQVVPTELDICWSNHRGRKTRYLIVPEPSLWARKLTEEPLNRRAWVLQERILSPRVLHFGHEQVFWECREISACETYYNRLPAVLCGDSLIGIKKLQLGDETKDERWPAKYISEAPKHETMMKRIRNSLMKMFRPIINQEVTLYAQMKSSSAFRDWDAVVELYSMSSLTYSKDKLIALAGIASSISISSSGEPADGYLAGMWQSSLPVYLLWKPRITETPQGGYSYKWLGYPKRYEEYIAPTWSWASIQGKISFAWCQHNYDSNDYLVTLEGASVSYDSVYRFGRVNSGYVRLVGPVTSILWITENPFPSAKPKTARITHVFPQHLNRSDSVSVTPDSDTEQEIFFDTAMEKIPEQLTLLPIIGITKRTAHENEAVIGLVLGSSAEKNRFQRIGFFYTTRAQVRRILTNMPRKPVMIV